MSNEERENRAGFSAAAFGIAAGLALVSQWVAALNGYPLMMIGDSADYLRIDSLWAESEYRTSFAYGLFRYCTSANVTLWITPIAQSAALFAALFFLFQRLSARGSLIRFAAISMAAICTSSLPLFTGRIHPDLFAPVLIILLYLNLFPGSARGRLASQLCYLAVAFMHTSYLMLAVLMPVVLLLLARPLGLTEKKKALLMLCLTGVVGWLLLFGRNLIIFKRPLPYATKGLILGPLVEYGVVDEYLASHCRDSRISLCSLQGRLNRDPDEFMWRTPATRIGASGAGEERVKAYQRLWIEIAWNEPLRVLGVIALSSFRALTTISEDQSLINSDMPAKYIGANIPRELPAFQNSRQAAQNGSLLEDASRLLALQRWLLIVAAALCAAAFLLRRRVQIPPPSPHLLRFTAIFLLYYCFNAVLCASFARVTDRYQLRLVWLALWLLYAWAAEASPQKRNLEPRLTSGDR